MNSTSRSLPLHRRAAALAAAVLGLTLAAAAVAGPRADGLGASTAAARQALAAHTLRSLDGRTLSLEAWRGQVVVVNFWASWCAPCRRELPALDRLNTEIRGQGGRVVAISIDEDIQNARRFAKARQLSLPLVHDGPDGLARTLDLQHVPLTLVIDRSGEIAWSTSASDEAAIQGVGAAVRRLLAVPAQDASLTSGGTR